MRVLLIHNFYQHFGGEDAAAQDDFQLLKARGIEVRMFSRHNDEIKAYGLLDKALFPIKTVSSPDTAKHLESTLREFPADVAYVHNIYPLISPSIYGALERRGIPIVQVLHDYRPFCANAWLYTNGQICERCVGGHHWNAVVHKCLHDSHLISATYAATMWNLKRTGAFDRVSAYICPSESARLLAVKNGIEPSKIVIRPHAVKLDEIVPGTTAGDYCLYLGRLSREKGIWTLLHAFDQLPDVPLLIAGTGPLAEEIQAYLEARSMRHVKLLGFQSGADKSRLLQNARVVIVPSNFFEVFGITVIEAYAAARPVIASDAGSLPFIVQDRKTGLLFPRGDASILRARVMELMADAEMALHMGKAGRRAAELHYTPDSAFESLMRVFEQVTTGVVGAACHG